VSGWGVSVDYVAEFSREREERETCGIERRCRRRYVFWDGGLTILVAEEALDA